MVFYEIEILSVPEIIFSWSAELDCYSNSFYNRDDFLEVCLMEQGSIVFRHTDGNVEMVKPGFLSVVTSDISCKTSAYNNEPQKHTTVGVNMKYNLKRYNSETDCDVHNLVSRMKEKHIILLPYQIPVGDSYDEILGMLKKISFRWFSDSSGNSVKALGQWYILMGFLTDFVLKRLNDKCLNTPAFEQVYADKAVAYIISNYKNKLTVKEISAHLGISEGYLHRIFRHTKNMSVLEYINSYRISVVKSLMENNNISLKNAGENVGIDDPAYMSRLFKKVTGMSCRDYMNIHKNRLKK